MIKNNIKHFKKAFSLAEILLSVTIVAIILLLAMPAITKKSLDNIISKGSDSAEFYFNDANNDNSVLPCYVTTIGSDNITTNITDNTGECQVYDFTIPKGVHKIDLTLVAGGGGGGGAGGGRIITKTLKNGDGPFSFNRTRLKKATINILTGAGTNGETTDPRKGGNSGTAIIDFTLPNNFIYKSDAIDMISGDYNSATPGVAEKVTATLDIQENALGFVDTQFTPVNVGFKGIGVKFTSKMNDGVSDYTSLLFLSDAASGSNPWASSQVMCATNITDPTLALADQVLNAEITTVSGKQDLSSTDNIVSQSCRLNPASYKASVEGKTPVGLPSSSETITTGKISMGGTGGNNGSYWFEKGKGGNGAQLVYNCFKADGSSATTTCKWTSGYNSNTYASDTTGGARYGEMSFELENPPSGGTGGVGGSAVKISNLVVRPGKTYKIVVGKGGAGGSKGTTGSAPSVGNQGTGGSATAIYDDLNKLVVMVAGGAGGKGGRISSAASLTQSVTLTAPTATRNTPVVIIGNDYSGKLNIDNEIATVAAITADDNVKIEIPNAYGTVTAQRLIYSFMSGMVQPMFSLSVRLNNYLTQTSAYNFDTYNSTTDGDRQMGGFSSYVINALTSSVNLTKAFINGTYSYKGTDINRPYTGFYFRYPILGSYYYAGGLGGFSGIGGKAGCGGAFVGNYYGYRVGTSAVTSKNITVPEDKLVNTIAMLKLENGTNTAKIFSLNEYFDGCTISTTDGHTAEFTAPVISNGKIENYGSAGSGGGGGGYNINLGPGNGADGQNGYVVITWKK